MRKLSVLLLTSALASTASGGASAGLLYWEGTLDANLGRLAEVKAMGSGVATVNGSSGSGHLTTLRIDGVNLMGSRSVFVSDPNVPTVATVIGSVGVGTGTLNGTWGGPSGPGPLTNSELPVLGNFKICMLLVGCSAFLDFPLQSPGGEVGVGVGGVFTINGFGPGLRMSMQYAPWTVGEVVFTGLVTTNAMIQPKTKEMTETYPGIAHGPASNTTSTGRVGAAVQIVTPTEILTTIMVPNNWIAAPFILSLHFVPEPGLMLLLASGVGGLALLGRHRLRR